MTPLEEQEMYNRQIADQAKQEKPAQPEPVAEAKRKPGRPPKLQIEQAAE